MTDIETARADLKAIDVVGISFSHVLINSPLLRCHDA